MAELFCGDFVSDDSVRDKTRIDSVVQGHNNVKTRVIISMYRGNQSVITTLEPKAGRSSRGKK
jgi:hypothetical protein